jgi:flavin reductase (DIM6/NTAB) family NADH-FMN oxidoreductase RutF
VLICIDYRCNVLTHFRASPFFGVNVLSEEQQHLSVRFSQQREGRFGGLAWHPGATHVPLIDGALARLECSVSQTVEAGDHAILIAEVVSAECGDGKPLLYFGSNYRQLADLGMKKR